ncbi:Rpn family recombination-promoting nuclease/putative transposase [Lentibacillus daqui]|uniref:Rpn family recombination-promoting nuclease/putative transposase n=1 Tax=Lentibacillus daqui TaxID=2911514 RepID=UPI0022B193DB|nr:Rpn family recombination-promoting nuclease/putative transposase [Lentibacillus daqui]
MERLNPLNDVAFKTIFTDEVLLKSLLNAILDFEISSIRLAENEVLPVTKDDKLGILDIKAYTDLGEKINIEVQLANQYNISERILYYWSKLFTAGFKKSRDYKELTRTVSISLLGYNVNNEADFHSCYQLLNRKTKKLLTNKLEIHFIETLKFMKLIENIDLKNPLHRWLIFLKSEDKMLLEEVAALDKNIAEAEEKLFALNLDKNLKEAYDAREREINDEITRMRGARDEGKEEGKREGKKEGKREGQKEIVEAMRKHGVTDEDIKKMTGIDPSELS